MIKNSTLVYLIDDLIPSGMRSFKLMDPEELLMDEITSQYLDDMEVDPTDDLIQNILKQVTA